MAQVRVIFTVPDKASEKLFRDIPTEDRPRYLAYVEWFSPFSRQPHSDHGMYPVSRSYAHGSPDDRLCSVVDIRRLVRSAHLLPRFGSVAPREWNSANVLETSPSFWFNTFSDLDMYQHFLL